jgi:hypothetical protein
MRVNRNPRPLWVRICLWGLPNRRSATLCQYFCFALAAYWLFAYGTIGLTAAIYPLFLAYFYHLAIRWMDAGKVEWERENKD